MQKAFGSIVSIFTRRASSIEELNTRREWRTCGTVVATPASLSPIGIADSGVIVANPLTRW